jgi:hypothetical protein
MTTEELIAAGLSVDPIVEGAENAAPTEDAGSPSGYRSREDGKFNQMTTKISRMWMPASVIWLKQRLPGRYHPLSPSESPRSQPI